MVFLRTEIMRQGRLVHKNKLLRHHDPYTRQDLLENLLSGYSLCLIKMFLCIDRMNSVRCWNTFRHLTESQKMQTARQEYLMDSGSI
ncbi:Uncharacterised protein [Porphyromonas cangingivalis]|uniref:Uncharacterized protein n=1 Tax=Porphyromonas cangingivalis TaxID=36874 RepID=A0A1T4NP66_PORCN|nr:hypothetical protein SAMN02745205_01961 [Porphyromonas cangingivalis]VEJ03633.1 Uncharacterised protein [Porphyromonas cangingivalis]